MRKRMTIEQFWRDQMFKDAEGVVDLYDVKLNRIGRDHDMFLRGDLEIEVSVSADTEIEFTFKEKNFKQGQLWTTIDPYKGLPENTRIFITQIVDKKVYYADGMGVIAWFYYDSEFAHNLELSMDIE